LHVKGFLVETLFFISFFFQHDEKIPLKKNKQNKKSAGSAFAKLNEGEL